MLVFDDVLVLAANIWLASSKICGCLTSQLQISSIFDISANDAGKDTSHDIVKFPSVCNEVVILDALLSVRSGVVALDAFLSDRSGVMASYAILSLCDEVVILNALLSVCSGVVLDSYTLRNGDVASEALFSLRNKGVAS